MTAGVPEKTSGILVFCEAAPVPVTLHRNGDRGARRQNDGKWPAFWKPEKLPRRRVRT